MEVFKVEEHNTFKKKLGIILFGVGLCFIFGGLLFALGTSLLGSKENIAKSLLFAFPALTSILLAVLIYPKVNYPRDSNQYLHTNESMNSLNSDILSDSAYCSVSGNTFHSDD